MSDEVYEVNVGKDHRRFSTKINVRVRNPISDEENIISIGIDSDGVDVEIWGNEDDIPAYMYRFWPDLATEQTDNEKETT